jgi:hypothetical protein
MRVETRKSRGPEQGWGFERECVYPPIPVAVPTIKGIAGVTLGTLKNIAEKGDTYLSGFASLSNEEKTVIHFLSALGAIRFEKQVPILNDPLNGSGKGPKLGTSFVNSLIAHIEISFPFFNGWENVRRDDKPYSIRQIISASEEMRFLIDPEKTPARIDRYALFLVLGRLRENKTKLCLLRENIDWGNIYLTPAERADKDPISIFCLRDLGIKREVLGTHILVGYMGNFEEKKVSPKTALLTQYFYDPILHIKLDPEGAKMVNNAAKIPFDTRNPESQERHFKWYTKEECMKDKDMMRVNGNVIRKIWGYIDDLGDDSVSFDVK